MSKNHTLPKNKRIKLSLFDNSDLALFIEMSTCPQMMKHVYKPFSVEEAELAFYEKLQPWSIENKNWLTFGITEVSSGEKLGNIGFKIINLTQKIAEVGFMIKSSAQGKGIASEALGLLIDYVFYEIKLKKLIAYCSTSNNASYVLLEKLGFIREAYLKENTLINNKLVDDYAYGLRSGTT